VRFAAFAPCASGRLINPEGLALLILPA